MVVLRILKTVGSLAVFACGTQCTKREVLSMKQNKRPHSQEFGMYLKKEYKNFHWSLGLS